MKVLLVSKATRTPGRRSIEAGLADGEDHFDHHFPCPSVDARIKPKPDQGETEVTHYDADTHVGVLRMMGRPLPGLSVDLNRLAVIDTQGSKGIPPLDPTLLYMTGVEYMAFTVGIPRATPGTEVDVTDKVMQIVEKTEDELIAIGRGQYERQEAAYRDKRVATSRNGKVGFWSITDIEMNPSRPYDDGFAVVVVFRAGYASASLYFNPAHALNVLNLPGAVETEGDLPPNYRKTVGGIRFCGHITACGSPRGQTLTEAEAFVVYDAAREGVDA